MQRYFGAVEEMQQSLEVVHRDLARMHLKDPLQTYFVKECWLMRARILKLYSHGEELESSFA